MRKPVWKVVLKKRRISCIVKKGKYVLSYKKGKITKAKKETLGVFCFKRKLEAENFSNPVVNDVIKVEPIGRGKTPNTICVIEGILERRFDKFYKDQRITSIRIPPYGTICYPAVKVLE